MVIPSAETTAPKPGALSIGDRLELRWSTGREVDGLWIGTIESDAESIIRRVEDAISVIRLHDPRRYRRLCHDLSRIWVRLLPGDLANFNSAIRACQLDSRHVRDEAVSASELAASIVHEATHARIDRCVPYREELRERIEAACVRRELAFARQLPDNHGLVERMHTRLTSPPPSAFWSDSEFEQRRVEGILEALCHLGVPRMLLPLLRATHRFSTAIRRRCKRSNNRLEPTNTAGRPDRCFALPGSPWPLRLKRKALRVMAHNASNVPKVRADFNGLFGELLCLAHSDTCVDESGASIQLRAGMVVTAFDEDSDERGVRDDLIATGTVEPSPDWLRCNGSKWALRIDKDGVRHESDLRRDT